MDSVDTLTEGDRETPSSMMDYPRISGATSDIL